MPDVTFEIRSVAAKQPNAPRALRRGDIVSVTNAGRRANKNGNQWNIPGVLSAHEVVYIHARDVPLSVFNKLGNFVRQEKVLNPDPDSDPDDKLPRRGRVFRIPIQDIPAAPRNTLLTDKEITRNWDPVVKGWMKKKRVVAGSENDPDQDIDDPVTDTDIETDF